MASASAPAFYPQISYSAWKPIESTSYTRPFVYNGDERALEAYISGPPLPYQVTDEEFEHDNSVEPEPSSSQSPASIGAPPPPPPTSPIDSQSPRSPPTSPRSEVRFASGTAPPAPTSQKAKKGILKTKKSTVFVSPPETEEEKNARLERIASMKQESEEKAKLLAIEKAARKEREKQVKLDALVAAKALEAERAAKRKEKLEKEKEEKARKAEQERFERIAKKEAAEASTLAKAEKARIKKEKQDADKLAREEAAAVAIAKQDEVTDVVIPEEAGSSSSSPPVPSSKDPDVKSAKNIKKDNKKDKKKDKSGKPKARSAATPAVPPPPPVPDPPSEAAPLSDPVIELSEILEEFPSQNPAVSKESPVPIEENLSCSQQITSEILDVSVDGVPGSEDKSPPEELPVESRVYSTEEQHTEDVSIKDVAEVAELTAGSSSKSSPEAAESRPIHQKITMANKQQPSDNVAAEILGKPSCEVDVPEEAQIEEYQSSKSPIDETTRELEIELQPCKDDSAGPKGDLQKQDHTDTSQPLKQGDETVLPASPSEGADSSESQIIDTDTGIVLESVPVELDPIQTSEELLSGPKPEQQEDVLQENESQAVEALTKEKLADDPEPEPLGISDGLVEMGRMETTSEAEASTSQLTIEDSSLPNEEQPSVEEETSTITETTASARSQPSVEASPLPSLENHDCLDGINSTTPDGEPSPSLISEANLESPISLESNPDIKNVQTTPLLGVQNDETTNKAIVVSESLDDFTNTGETLEILDSTDIESEPILNISLEHTQAQSILHGSQALPNDENARNESFVVDKSLKTTGSSESEQLLPTISDDTNSSLMEVRPDQSCQSSEIVSEQIAHVKEKDVDAQRSSGLDSQSTSGGDPAEISDVTPDQSPCLDGKSEDDEQALSVTPSCVMSAVSVEEIDHEDSPASEFTIAKIPVDSSEQLVIQAVEDDSRCEGLLPIVGSLEGGNDLEPGEIAPEPALVAANELLVDSVLVNNVSLDEDSSKDASNQVRESPVADENIDLDSSAKCFAESADLPHESTEDLAGIVTASQSEIIPDSGLEQGEGLPGCSLSLEDTERLEEMPVLPVDSETLLPHMGVDDSMTHLGAPLEKVKAINEAALMVNAGEPLAVEGDNQQVGLPADDTGIIETSSVDREVTKHMQAISESLQREGDLGDPESETSNQIHDDDDSTIELDIPTTLSGGNVGDGGEDATTSMNNSSAGDVLEIVTEKSTHSSSNGSSLCAFEETGPVMDLCEANESTKECGQLGSSNLSEDAKTDTDLVQEDETAIKSETSLITHDQVSSSISLEGTHEIITNSDETPSSIADTLSNQDHVAEDCEATDKIQEPERSSVKDSPVEHEISNHSQTAENSILEKIETNRVATDEEGETGTSIEPPDEASIEFDSSLKECGEILSATEEVVHDISQSIPISSEEAQVASSDVDATIANPPVSQNIEIVAEIDVQQEAKDIDASTSSQIEQLVAETVQETISLKPQDDRDQTPNEENSEQLMIESVTEAATNAEFTPDADIFSAVVTHRQAQDIESGQTCPTDTPLNRSAGEQAPGRDTPVEIGVKSAISAPTSDDDLRERNVEIMESSSSSSDLQQAGLVEAQPPNDTAPVLEEGSQAEDKSATTQDDDLVPQNKESRRSSASAHNVASVPDKNATEEQFPSEGTIIVEAEAAESEKPVDIQEVGSLDENTKIYADKVGEAVEETQPPVEAGQILDKAIVEEPERMTPEKGKENILMESPASHKRRHRSSRHSSQRHSSSRDLAISPPSNLDEAPSVSRSRRLSENGGSLKALWSGLTAPRQASPPSVQIQKPVRVDSGIETGSTSSHGKHRKRRSTLDDKVSLSEDVKVAESIEPKRNSRGRTVEEQEAHDKRKAERRASRALENQKADVTVQAPVFPPAETKSRRLSHRRQSISQHVDKQDNRRRSEVPEIEKESVVKSPTFLANGKAMVKETKGVSFTSPLTVVDLVEPSEALGASRSVDTKSTEKTRMHSERPKLETREHRSSRRHTSSRTHPHSSHTDRSLPKQDHEISDRLDPERQARRLRREEEKKHAAERTRIEEEEARISKEKEEADRIARRADRRRKRAEEEHRLVEEQQQQEKERIAAIQKQKVEEQNKTAEKLAFDLGKDKDGERRRERRDRGDDMPRERTERVHRNSLRRNRESEREREKEKEKKGGLSSLWRGAKKAFA